MGNNDPITLNIVRGSSTFICGIDVSGESSSLECSQNKGVKKLIGRRLFGTCSLERPPVPVSITLAAWEPKSKMVAAMSTAARRDVGVDQIEFRLFPSCYLTYFDGQKLSIFFPTLVILGLLLKIQ